MGRTCLCALLLTAITSVITNCGGSKSSARPERPDAVSGATEPSSSNESGAGSTEGEASPTTVHICKRPIDAPADVWPRIEAIRALDEQEFQEKCDLSLVDVFSKWRCISVDLLGPMVTRASADGDEIVDWVKERIESDPTGAACVVAMDVIGSFKLGADPEVVAQRAKTWEQVASKSEEIAAVLEPVESLGAMLKEINEIHKLRCMLEVNVLGFAVKCKPIHPQGTSIDLSWETATRDGLIEDVKLTSCKGKTCKKLKTTAKKLKTKYLGLVKKIEKVQVEIYREQMKAWLVLPPFKSQT